VFVVKIRYLGEKSCEVNQQWCNVLHSFILEWEFPRPDVRTLVSMVQMIIRLLRTYLVGAQSPQSMGRSLSTPIVIL